MSDAVEVGQILKGYELKEILGKGGFGAVYRAYQPLVKREVAMKVILPAFANRPSFVRRFETEAQLVAQLEQYMSAFMVMIYIIVLGITAAVIVNTLIMAVFERTREIGILSAIGMKSSRIMFMFFAESFFLAVGGVAIGLVLGGIVVGLMAHYGFYLGEMGVQGFMLGERIYPYLTLNDAVTLSVTAFFITLLAAIYPAALAARMEPVDAMRGGKQA